MSQSLDHLMAGTDFSDSSRGAVGEALRLGGRYGSTVSIVHIATSNATETELETQMQAFLASETVPDNLTLRTRIVRHGKVAVALGEYAERESVDLLVVGPRARTFMERHITGGIAEQLFSRTSVSVLATPRVVERYRRVLVAVDDSEASAHALALGATLLRADDPDASLVALHVLAGRGVDAIASVEEAREIEAALIEDVRQHYEPLLARHAAHVPEDRRRVVVRVGALGSQIPHEVQALDPDLVCMGTVGRKGVFGLLAGNAADQVIRTIDRPLLVAHP